jgi:hypothetical protein
VADALGTSPFHPAGADPGATAPIRILELTCSPETGPNRTRIFRFREEDEMAGKRRTPEEISYVLAQAEAGIPIKELCRKYGVAEATFYA